jgi:threonylcarbamoyladenosine tRNA methylthiotransferase MtaB
MEFTDIEDNIRALENNGYHEIVISGINLGDYRVGDRREESKRFVNVVRHIDSMELRSRIRISSIEPNLLSQDIIDVVAQSNTFVPHFHIPLQSGSPEILRHMRRRYTAPYYQDLIYRIKDSIPDCCIGVDVIVGFPLETDELFEETYSFLQALPISYLHVFSYSERPNTPSASMDKLVTPQQRKERSKRLRILSEKKKHEFYHSQLGTNRTVIPEQRDDATGTWIGWTENYVRVQFEGTQSLLQIPTKVHLEDHRNSFVHSTFLSQEITSQKHRGYISLLS